MAFSDTNRPAVGYLYPDANGQAQVQQAQDSTQPITTFPGMANFANSLMTDTARSSGAHCSSAAQQLTASQNPFSTEPFPAYADPFDAAAATSADIPMGTKADNGAGYQTSENSVAEPSTNAQPSAVAGPSTPVRRSCDRVVPSFVPTPSLSCQLVMPEGRKKNGAPIDWNFTEKPVPYKGNGNGR